MCDQAIEWMLRLEGHNLTDLDRANYEAWRREDPRHVETMEKLTKITKHFDVPRNMGIGTDTILKQLEQSTNRRSFLRNIALIAGTVAGAGWLGHREVVELNLGADFRTTTGQRRSYRLPDQSLITLNTNSAADIIFDGRERLVRLRAGQLMAWVAHDRDRPFVVGTPYGSVRALGTQYQVRLLPNEAEVAVASSKVEVHTQSGAVGQLLAGQSITFSANAIGTPTQSKSGNAAWVDGYFVGLDTPLIDFIDALRPYRRGIIRVDPTVASLRVSAAIPLDDPDRALNALANTLPIEVNRIAGFWTTVSARNIR